MNDKQDFTQGSIPVKMVRFMIPILGALILQAMYSAAVEQKNRLMSGIRNPVCRFRTSMI